MCTYCYDNELQGKTIFHILGEGEGGKTEPSLGLPLHLTSGFDCAGSLTHSVWLYDLSCLSHRLYSSLFFPLPPTPSLLFFRLYSPCHCRLSVNQQATYQRLLLHLCHSGIGIGTAHLLFAPLSSPAVYSMCISIYPNVITRFNMSAGGRGRVHYSAVFLSECNVDSESSSGAGLGRECVHHVASAVMDTFVFFYCYLHINIMRVPMISNGQKVNRHAPIECFQLEQHLLKTKVTVCWALITLFSYAEFVVLM